MTNIFLIGPGGVGKSSIGEELSKIAKLNFIDQDEMFKKEYGEIGIFGKEWNWKIFTIRNSRNLLNLIKKNQKSIYATSPKAFINPLVPETEQIVSNRCKQNGITALVLPSRFFLKTKQIIWERIKLRLYKPDPKVFQEDFTKELVKQYKNHADIIIYDNISPKSAAQKIYKKLKSKNII
jgi:shikimate kinase